MQGFATMLKATAAETVRMRADATSEQFQKAFGITDGDYLEVDGGKGWRQHRIMMIDECYYNQRGGWTAYVKTAYLNWQGRLSTNKTLILTVNSSGKGLSVLRPGNLGDKLAIRIVKNPNRV